MPINYQNGKIYKIYSLNNPELQYIGSTTQTLAQRLAKHKARYKYRKKTGEGERYTTSSFKIFEECDDYRIELIELCPCNSKMELHRTEGKYISKMDCVNKRIAGRTKKEYHQANREKILQQKKEYYQANKQAIEQYKKEYHQANREKIKQREKQYKEANKDKIKARKSIKITCECGSVVCKGVIARHKRSQKHQRLMNQQ